MCVGCAMVGNVVEKVVSLILSFVFFFFVNDDGGGGAG